MQIIFIYHCDTQASSVTYFIAEFFFSSDITLLLIRAKMKVKCQVFTAAGVNVTALWDIAPCIIEDDRDSIIRAMSIIRQIKSRRIRCETHGRGEKVVQGFGGKARKKENTRKTEA
jgi:hypothetical protein